MPASYHQIVAELQQIIFQLEDYMSWCQDIR